MPAHARRIRSHAIPPPRLTITITARRRGLPKALSRWIAAQLRKLAALTGARGSLNVAIVGDTEMSRLHLHYKQIAGPTDVLTFDLRDEPASRSSRQTPARTIEGDVVICFDEARRQARLRGHTERLELLLYALHGLLHLMGYDDLTPGEHRRMHRREDELLQRAGLGAVFAPAACPPKSRARQSRGRRSLAAVTRLCGDPSSRG